MSTKKQKLILDTTQQRVYDFIKEHGGITSKGANGESLAFAQVAVFVRDPDTKEWSDPIVGIGGSKLINKFSAGPKSNDEGYKMAVTDAFSTSLKMIGVAADIYAGRWDGSKYNQEPSNRGEGSAPDRKHKAKQS